MVSFRDSQPTVETMPKQAMDPGASFGFVNSCQVIQHGKLTLNIDNDEAGIWNINDS